MRGREGQGKRKVRKMEDEKNIREPVSRCVWEGKGQCSSHTSTATQEFPSGDSSLIAGNHGRLLKIQLPPISLTVTRPTFFDVDHVFPSVQTYLLCRVLPTTTTLSAIIAFWSTSTLTEDDVFCRLPSRIKKPRGNKRHLISP